MVIEENVALQNFTTLRVGGNARFFVSIKSEDDLREAYSFARDKGLEVFVLGGGSNTFFGDGGFAGLIVKVDILGRDYQATNDGDAVLARVAAGEDWDAFVAETVKRDFSGLENLSLIPGTVGAAPVQNIGAYGVEQSDVCVAVRVFDPERNDFFNIPASECGFGYRTSLFKENPGRIIVQVTYQLSKQFRPNLSYQALAAGVEEMGVAPESLTAKQVRDMVIAIRSRKLPDWKQLPTAGSFFKNPVVSRERFEELVAEYPDLPGFETEQGIKVSLAWIIEHLCGLRGARHGNAGIYERHALVLVNHGSASAEDILELVRKIAACVREKTGIEIEREVQFAGEQASLGKALCC